MAAFKDALGRDWTVRIDVTAQRRLRNLLSVDINKLVEQELRPLKEDTVLLCDVLFVLCKEQAEYLKVTDEDFGRALLGDSLARATEALVEAIIDFFPSEQARKALRKAEGIRKKAEAKAYEVAMDRLDQIDVEQLARTLTEQSTESPATSG